MTVTMPSTVPLDAVCDVCLQRPMKYCVEASPLLDPKDCNGVVGMRDSPIQVRLCFDCVIAGLVL